MTLEEFVLKASSQPARWLGLTGKGHLGEGADADIAVVDSSGDQAYLTVVGGKVIMLGGLVTGRGTTILTTNRGWREVQERGLRYQIVSLEEAGFYRGKAFLWDQ